MRESCRVDKAGGRPYSPHTVSSPDIALKYWPARNITADLTLHCSPFLSLTDAAVKPKATLCRAVLALQSAVEAVLCLLPGEGELGRVKDNSGGEDRRDNTNCQPPLEHTTAHPPPCKEARTAVTTWKLSNNSSANIISRRAAAIDQYQALCLSLPIPFFLLSAKLYLP